MVSGSTAILWLIVAGVAQAVAGIGALHGLGSVALPSILPPDTWDWPPLWTAFAAALGALAIGLLHATAAYPVIKGGQVGASGRWIPLWFGAVVAGAVVGLAIDAFEVLGPRLLTGEWIWLSEPGAYAAAGGYWGLLYGWVPALIAVRLAAVAPADEPAITRRARVAWVSGLATVSVFAVFAFAAVSVAGLRMDRVEQAQQDARAAGYDESLGALPDPLAGGFPVPTVAPRPVDRDPSWCTTDQATVLLGKADAATKHRVQSLRFTNFSDTPCAIEGYPDVAFADQNGHLLEVTLERGSSFMASDKGRQRIEIPAGASAIAYISWDGRPTAGALVAHTLFAAPVAGDVRGSWPIEADILSGATVTITAWAPDQVRPAAG